MNRLSFTLGPASTSSGWSVCPLDFDGTRILLVDRSLHPPQWRVAVLEDGRVLGKGEMPSHCSQAKLWREDHVVFAAGGRLRLVSIDKGEHGEPLRGQHT